MALIEKLKNIANAIRSKTNKSEELTLEQMASEVEGIDTWQGLNFEGVFDEEQANEINQYYKDGIAYTGNTYENPKLIFCPYIYIPNLISWSSKFSFSARLQAIDKRIDTSQITSFYNAFLYCRSLFSLPVINCVNATSLYQAFYGCASLEEVEIINTQNITSMYYLFRGCSFLKRVNPLDLTSCVDITNMLTDCVLIEEINLYNTNKVEKWTNAFNVVHKLRRIYLGSVEGATSFRSIFNSTNIELIHFSNWKNLNISIIRASKLFPESIHYIIQNAMDVADGATIRTLTLHATAKTNWQNSEYYEQDLAVLEQKGITIA